MPNVNAALFFRPAEVEILASADTETVAEHTMQALHAEGIRTHSPHLVDPYDASETRTKALALVREHVGAKFIFNITGGTKIMSIGLYNAALDTELDDSTLSIIYLEPQRDRVIYLPRAGHWYDKPLQVSTPIGTYLLAHGWQVDEERCADASHLPEGWLRVTEIMARARVASRELVALLRKLKGGDPAPCRLFLPELLDAAEVDLLHALQNVGLLQDVEPHPDGWALHIPGEREWRFLDGDWLEVYVYNALQASKTCDEVRMGICVHDHAGVFQEMDVLATRNGRLLYISCKTTRRNLTEYLNEMDAVARIAGGLNCAKVFVTNAPSPQQDAQMREFNLHAQNRRVLTLYGDDLPGIGPRLVRELARPTYGPM